MSLRLKIDLIAVSLNESIMDFSFEADNDNEPFLQQFISAFLLFLEIIPLIDGSSRNEFNLSKF